MKSLNNDQRQSKAWQIENKAEELNVPFVRSGKEPATTTA